MSKFIHTTRGLVNVDHVVSVRGNDSNRASDHVPVFVDLVFEDPATPPSTSDLRIVALTPNPAGTDNRNEKVTLRNGTVSDVDLSAWTLTDEVKYIEPKERVY